MAYDLNPPAVPTGNTFSLFAPETAQFYPADYSELRANRYNLALGQNSPGIDSLRSSVLNGDTSQWDQVLSTIQRTKDEQARQGVIGQVMAGRDPTVPPSPAELQFVQNLSRPLFDPDQKAALNREYSNQYTNLMNTVAGNIPYPQAADQAPNGALDLVDQSQWAAQRNLEFQDIYKEIQKSREDEGIITTGYNFLKEMLPGYTNIISRNSVSGAPATPLLQGNNWDEQISYLHSLPPEVAASKLRQAVADIKSHDPALAEEFAKAAVSYGTSDRGHANVMDIGNFALMAPIGKVAKGAEIGIGGLKSLGSRLATGAERSAAERAETAAPSVLEDTRIPGQQTSLQGEGSAVAANDNPGGTLSSTPPNTRVTGTANPDLPANSNLPGSPRSKLPEVVQAANDNPNGTRFGVEGTNTRVTGTANPAFPVNDNPVLPPGSPRRLPGAPKLPSALGDLEQGLDKVQASVVEDPTNIPKIAGHSGLNEVASKTKMAGDIASGDPSGLSTVTAANVEDRLPSSMAPARAYTEKVDMSGAAKNKINEVALRAGAILKSAASDLINKLVRVDRLEPNQLQVGANETFDAIKDIFQSVNHNIMDHEVGRYIHPAEEDRLTNLYQVSVRFGNRDGTLFQSRAAAENFVRRNISPRTNDFAIKPDGVGGYYAEVRRNVSEVDAVRDMEIPTDMRTPDTLATRFLHGWRAADYELPQSQVMARGRVIHSGEFMSKYLGKLSKDISLSSDERAGVEKVLRSNRANLKWQRTDADFAAEYLARNGKLPTQSQTEAYRSIVNLYDLDYTLRDADIVTQKSRLGGETFSFNRVSLKDGQIVNEPVKFDGKEVDNIPYASKDKFMVVMQDGSKPGKKIFSGFIGEKERELIANTVGDGAKIVLDPSEATYYVIKDFKRDRIQLGSLGFQEGGHHEYTFDHFIKQGDVRPVSNGVGANPVRHYRGDISLASAPTKDHATEITRLLNQGREMLRAGDPRVNTFWRDKLSDFMPLADFNKKVASGELSLDVPFVATQKGQRTLDVTDWSKGIENFFDSTTNEHNIFGPVTGRYIGEKAAYRLDVLQSEGGRIVKTTHEALLDPWETMRTSTSNLLDTAVVNDYRQKVASDWGQEFAHVIDADPNKVRANPMEYLNNPRYKQGADPNQSRAAENVRLRTLQLTSYQTTLDRQLANYKSKLADKAYDIGGPAAQDFINTAITEIGKADTYMRAMAYHFKMGMFSPKTFFQQASEIAKIAAISPLHGTNAMRQLWVNRMALMTENDQVLRGLANRWSKLMGVDKDDWLRQIDSFKRSGFSIVGHDQAFLDSVQGMPQGSTWTGLRNASTLPFTEGELAARNLAYSTAWSEWRQANPGKIIDRYGESWVLQRAKDLTNNMGRDSSAVWQKGFSATLTQFFGYHARLMEQLWDGGILGNGRKLSRGEKLRTVVGMSALYGVPAGVTSAVGVYPIRQAIKSWYAQNGEPLDDGVNPFMDGVIAWSTSAMLGENYDVTATYGPTGIPTFYELFNGDKSWTDVLGGASGGILADTVLKTLGGTANVLSDVYNLDKDTSSFPLIANDLLDPLRNISSVDSGVRLWQIMNTAQWISKSGSRLANDATFQEGIANMMFGVTPQRISDAYDKVVNSGRVKDAQAASQTEVRQLIQKASQYANNGDINGARAMYKRARVSAIQNGLTPAQYNAAVSQGFNESPLTDRADDVYNKFYNRNINNRVQGQ